MIKKSRERHWDYHYKARELIVIAFVLSILGVAMLVQFGLVSIPVIVQTIFHDGSIYQTVVAVQGSLVGVSLAIITVIATLSDVRIYGASYKEYTMEIRPLFIFKVRYVFVESIGATALSWVCVALGLFDVAVGLFFANVLLLAHFVVANVEAVVFPTKIENVVKHTILNSTNIAPLEALFSHLAENITTGNVLSFDKNAKFIKEELLVAVCTSSNEIRINVLQDCLITTINAVSKSNSRFISGILSICSSAIESANNETSRGERAVKLSRLTECWEMYMLISKANLSDLVDDDDILAGLHKALFWHMALDKESLPYNRSQRMHRSYTCTIAYRIKENVHLQESGSANRETAYTALLSHMQCWLHMKKIDDKRIYDLMECEFINLIVRLFELREERILEFLFGKEKGMPHWRTIFPAMPRYGNALTKHNVYFMIYMYYIGYKEYHGVAEKEKQFCKDLLKQQEKNDIWFDYRKENRTNEDFLTMLEEWVADFSELIDRHVRWEANEYGGGSRTWNACTLIKDFFVKSLTFVMWNVSELEEGVSRIARAYNRGEEPSNYQDEFYTYVDNSDAAIEKFKEFAEIMGMGYLREQNFRPLQEAITNLYRMKELSVTAEASTLFDVEQDRFCQWVKEAVSEKLKGIASKFLEISDGDSSMVFTDEACQRWYTPPKYFADLGEWSRDFAKRISEECEREFCKSIARKIESYVNSIGRKKREEATSVKDFFGAIGTIKPTLIMGYPAFYPRDEHYDDFKTLRESCEEIRYYNGCIAIDSSLVKICVRNISVEVLKVSDEQAFREIEKGDVMRIGNQAITLDVDDAFSYLKNNYRFAIVRYSMAIRCTEDVIGGGYTFSDISQDKESKKSMQIQTDEQAMLGEKMTAPSVKKASNSRKHTRKRVRVYKRKPAKINRKDSETP